METAVKGKTCKAMMGLIAEGGEVVKEHAEDGSISDLAVIAAAQKVEHYELSGYGTARTMAEQLGGNRSCQSVATDSR